MSANKAAALQRKQEVAAEIAKGTTGREIAKKMGIRHETVSRLANSPETKIILADMLRPHAERLQRMVDKSLAVIEDAYDAKRVAPSKDGETIDLGKDHFARLAASKRLQELLQTAREGEQAAGAGTITWEMFLQLRKTMTRADD